MEKIILNSKALLSRNDKFFGREEEVSQLLLSLSKKRGSTTLVSGDRGSGKTSLIDEAVKTSTKQLRDTLFFNLKFPKARLVPEKIRGKKFIPKKVRYTSVVVKVPLIPPDTEPDMLKGIVLRAIIHTLVVDRPFGGYFLYPLTYRYHLDRLKTMVKYKHRAVERGLSFGGSSGQAEAKLNQVYKSELDLSDIRIELMLASFFSKFAKKLRFVIIFDETDKYEDSNDSEKALSPEKLIYHTKNLFTTNGAHFIFVSTEDYYYRLQGRILSDKREAAHTFFTNTVIINHLSPEDFVGSLRAKITNYEELKDSISYHQFEQAMMWSSNLYPFEQNKQLMELPGRESFTIEFSRTEEYYSEYWETFAAMHRLITRIYNKSSRSKDSYYNRYLYRVLREVSKFLFISTDIGPINRNNLLGVIFYNDTFTVEAQKADFLIKECSRINQPALNTVTWKNRIYELSISELMQIEQAVEDLFWRLDKMGLIAITRDSSWETPINIKASLINITFESIDRGFPKINSLTTKEKRLISKYQLAYNRYRNLNNASTISAPNVGVAKISLQNNNWIAEPSDKNQRFSADIVQELEIIKAYELELNNHLLKTLHAWLSPYSPANLAVLDLTGDVLTVEDTNGKKMLILDNPQNGKTKTATEAKTKVIVIHKFANRYSSECRSTYLKKYFVAPDFKGYQATLTDSKNVIKNYFKI